jgi:TonB-dependent starch-binding outer membrane protein SusC
MRQSFYKRKTRPLLAKLVHVSICLFFVLFALAPANAINGNTSSDPEAATVNGIVKDAANGAPLPGVNIMIKGTSEGTISDLDGKFSLEVPDLNTTLVFSFIGYKSIELPLAGKSQVEVTLSEDTKGLDEVVVVGYGVQKKKLVTGATVTVKEEDIQQRHSTRLERLCKD